MIQGPLQLSLWRTEFHARLCQFCSKCQQLCTVALEKGIQHFCVGGWWECGIEPWAVATYHALTVRDASHLTKSQTQEN